MLTRTLQKLYLDVFLLSKAIRKVYSRLDDFIRALNDPERPLWAKE